MNNDEKKKCQKVIHSAAVAAAGIGFVPIPGADSGPICAIQAGMIIALARVFKISITKDAAVSISKTFIVGNIGKTIVGQLSKFIPIVGSSINASVAAALTEALGWEIAEDFDNKKCNKNENNDGQSSYF